MKYPGQHTYFQYFHNEEVSQIYTVTRREFIVQKQNVYKLLCITRRICYSINMKVCNRMQLIKTKAICSIPLYLRKFGQHDRKNV